MTRALILFTSSLLLAGCGSRSDTAIRKNLPGAWHVVLSPEESGSQSIFSIAPNGDFTSQLIFSNGVHSIDIAGTLQVQDGYLIETVTNSTQRNAHLPLVSRAKIVHADDSEMVVVFDGTTDKHTIRKDTR
jgi:hypothetical protein